MSAILKFDFQKREQLCFSEVNYLNYTKKTQFCMWQLQGETRASHGPIPHPLIYPQVVITRQLTTSFGCSGRGTEFKVMIMSCSDTLTSPVEKG